MGGVNLGMRINPVGHVDRAVEAWRQKIGSDYISNDVSVVAADTSAWSVRPSVVLRPRTVAQVQDIVGIARQFSVPIYPISTGRNWGYGTAVPAVAASAVVDLSGMNRILSFDRELGIVTIEPGVTQAALYDYLRQNGLPFIVPVTGAGPDCSLIGNVLERGFGLTPVSDHFSAMLSLAAVLPDGTLYQSPLRGDSSETFSPYKWGIGPYIDGLFAQSGMGIVVNMTIALAPVSDRQGAFLFSIGSDGALETIVGKLRHIMSAAGPNIGGINIIGRDRINAMLEGAARVRSGPDAEPVIPTSLSEEAGDWIVFGTLYGSKLHYRATCRLIRKSLPAAAKQLRFLSHCQLVGLQWLNYFLRRLKISRNYRSLEQLSAALGLVEGIPSSVALRLAYARSGASPSERDLNPARDGCGILWYSPIVPMRAGALSDFLRLARTVCAKHQFDMPITLTAISPRYFSATLAILFDPQQADQAKRATDCYSELFDSGRSCGFHPYRMGTQFMDELVDESHPYWRIVASLKEALDPTMIFAPGRYSAVTPKSSGSNAVC